MYWWVMGERHYLLQILPTMFAVTQSSGITKEVYTGQIIIPFKNLYHCFQITSYLLRHSYTYSLFF